LFFLDCPFEKQYNPAESIVGVVSKGAKMKGTFAVAGLITLVSLPLMVGCAPGSFVKGRSAGWETIELNDSLKGNYDLSWQKTVNAIAQDYDIEMMDKGSGYLRTSWLYGISGGSNYRYCGRITVKYPEVREPEKFEVKTDAQWLHKPTLGVWHRGWDKKFNREVSTILSECLGRTVSPD